MKKTLDHIGVAIRDMQMNIDFYENVLGATLIDHYRSDAKGVESEIAIMDIDGDRTELLAPTNNTTSPIARFIKQNGKGVHHVAYHVGDLDEALKELKEKGVRTLPDSLRTNKHGRRLIYLNPADTDGTIIEYCDYPEST
ncbi:VOC family protein [Pontibacillus yanchengensis]|uniref:Glyoxalase n=1 Tax=Pontibacillus yanchengensis Y32 TaxID=1385514 RepID=A0A0A2T8K6_9BACI|nr:VOC family protein [Pontibacillus yanchengensis]KGP72157.1 glyoxalase [Pontibacillus yanchengensis Y32]